MSTDHLENELVGIALRLEALEERTRNGARNPWLDETTRNELTKLYQIADELRQTVADQNRTIETLAGMVEMLAVGAEE
jgi:hypothetical protein